MKEAEDGYSEIDEVFIRAGCYVIKDIEKTKDRHVHRIYVGPIGIYVVMWVRLDNKNQVDTYITALKKEFGFRNTSTYFYMMTQAGDLEVYMDSRRTITDLKEEIIGLVKENENQNILGKSYINALMSVINDKKRANEIGLNSYYSNGILYEKHSVPKDLLGIIRRNEYCPVADEKPLKFIAIAFIGGIFGAHKFVTGEWGKGILYLFTCGGFGVCYCFDIISILLGTYSVRQIIYEEVDKKVVKRIITIYLPRLKKTEYVQGIGMLAGAIAISVVVYGKVYIPLLCRLGEKLMVNI